jgi:hypothetical protein
VRALGDRAAVPAPDGKTYPPLAQHAVRQTRVLAGNIAAALRGREELQPFVYESQGTLATLGHFDGVAKLRRLPVRGVPAWSIWRAYDMLPTPQPYRRLRILIDGTLALLFKVDIVNFDLSVEEQLLHWIGEWTGSPGDRSFAFVGLVGSVLQQAMDSGAVSQPVNILTYSSGVVTSGSCSPRDRRMGSLRGRRGLA